MNPSNNNPALPSGDNAPDRTPAHTPDREVLISRLIDCRASDADWQSLRTLSQTDVSLWNDIAMSQRQTGQLASAVAPALLAAERTQMPDRAGETALPRLDALNGWPDRFSMARSSRLGWAIAAMIALAWTSTLLAPGQSRIAAGPNPGNTAGLVSVSTPDEAFSAYLDKGKESGRVVAEMPQRIVLESRPAADGKGYEVLYVRQILERATVSDLYRAGISDTGDKVYVPTTPPPPRTNSSGAIGL